MSPLTHRREDVTVAFATRLDKANSFRRTGLGGKNERKRKHLNRKRFAQ